MGAGRRQAVCKRQKYSPQELPELAGCALTSLRESLGAFHATEPMNNPGETPLHPIHQRRTCFNQTAGENPQKFAVKVLSYREPSAAMGSFGAAFIAEENAPSSEPMSAMI